MGCGKACNQGGSNHAAEKLDGNGDVTPTIIFSKDRRLRGVRPTYRVEVILAATVLHLWMFLHLNLEAYPMATRVGIGIHAVACVGAFWMLYDWFVKRGKRTWKAWMWLFFVPWGFLWYYFEKYRPANAGENRPA
jgi:hypothetical protein